jgi:polyphosphate glucokinase
MCIRDSLYIGGGNAKKITVPLPANVTVVSNDQGLLGGIKLWQGAINSEFGGIIKLCKAQTEP